MSDSDSWKTADSDEELRLRVESATLMMQEARATAGQWIASNSEGAKTHSLIAVSFGIEAMLAQLQLMTPR